MVCQPQLQNLLSQPLGQLWVAVDEVQERRVMGVDGGEALVGGQRLADAVQRSLEVASV